MIEKMKKTIFIIFMLLFILMITTIQPSALEQPQNTEITRCMTITEGRLTISWKNVGSDGYELALSKDKNFKDDEKETYTYSGERSKAAIKDLDYDTVYYFKVRSFNEINDNKIYSDWTDTCSKSVNGHNYVWYKKAFPTCTEEGLEYEKCTRCYKETGNTRVIPALGHTYKWINDGKTWYNKCQICGDVKETKPVIITPKNFTTNVTKKTIGVKGKYKVYLKSIVPKNADKSIIFHSKNNKIAVVNNKGIIVGKKLGKTKIVVKSKINKKLKKVIIIHVKKLKPTKLTLNTTNIKIKYGEKYQLKTQVHPLTMYCSKTFYSLNKKIATIDKYGVIKGKKAGKTTIIVRTNKKNKKGKYLYKTCKVKVSHNYKLIKTVKATCSKDGYKEYKCNCCKKTYKKILKKVGHNYKLIETKNVTCVTDGYEKYECIRCHKISTKITKKKLGHQWQTIEELNQTCETNGYKKEKCINCNEIKNTELKATGHNYSILLEHKDSTCKEKGYDIYKCKDCEKTKKIELPLIDHNYSITVERKEATDNEDGYIIKKCSCCDEIKKEILTKDKTYTIDLGNGETTTVVGHYEREMEEEMFNAVNQYRRENNKKELESGYYKLKNAADIRSYEISYYFDHYRPNGERALVSFKHTTNCCGENIARNQKTVEKAMNDFKNSYKHNALMLFTDPDTLSVSVFAKYEGTVNGKKQYSLHYVQFYGWYPYSYQK